MLKFQIMWSRNSPFALISIGGIRHSKDPRFWVEQPNVNNTSKQSWVSTYTSGTCLMQQWCPKIY